MKKPAATRKSRLTIGTASPWPRQNSRRPVSTVQNKIAGQMIFLKHIPFEVV
jgi:hypothetical protein